MEENEVEILEFPKYSPDMAPIENVWPTLDSMIDKKNVGII